MMSRKLAPDSTIDTLKKEAKRWLRQLRDGDPRARQRLLAIVPTASADPGLRGIQFALARDYGFEGWPALKDALAQVSLSRLPESDRADIVLRSCWQGDRLAAARLLAQSPTLARHNLFVAVASGNIEHVRSRLSDDPALARRRGGPLDWEPLLYLAYARLPGGDDYAIEIARLLLDQGADPNASFDDGWGNSFTVLTGVIGEGEGAWLPHPHAEAFAELLIERGADPFDRQALYNTSITRDDTRWLDFLWRHSERRGLLDDWRKVPQPGLGGRIPMDAADYLLGNAVAFNHPHRVRWLLAHGANADGVHAYSGRPLREEALIHGHVAIAELLVEHGAKVVPLEPAAAFQAACMRLDREAARELVQDHPECLKNPEPMLTAARQGRADIVSLLLELGMDVDICDDDEQRAIQNAVMGNSLEVVKLLVAHGANVDRPTKRVGGAMGFAAHFQRREIADYLAPLSRDVFNLAYLGMIGRIGELLTEDPALANVVLGGSGITPLFCLPDDEDSALETAELLLSFGADPTIRDKKGVSAEQAASRRGLLDVVERMREATGESTPRD